MPRIFLCYRRSETEPVARRICDRLREQYGPRVFMDLGQVPLGSDFRRFIGRELEGSDVMLVLIGPRWLDLIRSKANQAHDFVRTEIEVALATNRLTIPILVGESATMPREDELPPRIASLAYLQGFRLLPDQDFEGQMRRLIAGLDHALAFRLSAGQDVRPEAMAATETAAAPADSPAPRPRRVDCADLDLIWVGPGRFRMGSPEGEPGRWPDEGPQHEVTISSGFWVGVVPVTQAQYAAVMEDNPSHFKEAGGNAPVEMVSWRDARDFCQKLQRRERPPAGYEYRLPTEAEWEYACRAGTQTALFNGPLEIRGSYHAPGLDPIAWYGGNSGVDYPGGADSSAWFEKQYDHQRAGTHPVAQKAPNAWGIFDMLGNVWEWCWDGKRPYRNSPAEQPAGPVGNHPRVIRGGSWEDGPGDCRCATRFAAGERHRYPYLGFRLVLAPPVKLAGAAGAAEGEPAPDKRERGG